jgi:hypothetical protein
LKWKSFWKTITTIFLNTLQRLQCIKLIAMFRIFIDLENIFNINIYKKNKKIYRNTKSKYSQLKKQVYRWTFHLKRNHLSPLAYLPRYCRENRLEEMLACHSYHLPVDVQYILFIYKQRCISKISPHTHTW